jgi:putative hemolysin
MRKIEVSARVFRLAGCMLLLGSTLLTTACGGGHPEASHATTSPAAVTPVDGGARPKVGIANPASTHCIDKGGTLSVEKRPDGGEYGVCVFADNQQCEEWALFRGHCPVGGVKVTGYMTAAARFCAITGGTYAVTANSGSADERGSCSFIGGTHCDAGDYYEGRCDPRP